MCRGPNPSALMHACCSESTPLGDPAHVCSSSASVLQACMHATAPGLGRGGASEWSGMQAKMSGERHPGFKLALRCHGCWVLPACVHGPASGRLVIALWPHSGQPVVGMPTWVCTGPVGMAFARLQCLRHARRVSLITECLMPWWWQLLPVLSVRADDTKAYYTLCGTYLQLLMSYVHICQTAAPESPGKAASRARASCSLRTCGAGGML